MGDLNNGSARGSAATTVWKATCKDCQAEVGALGNRRPSDHRQRTPKQQHPGDSTPPFEYSDNWAHRTIERGNSRSDRCERHRKAHRSAIQAISVAYIDLQTIGEVADRQNPTGPLGGLGPLPTLHKKQTCDVDLDGFEFGMSDADIMQLLDGLAHKRVAVVEAGTGTGKSTFMPFRLMSPPPGAAMRLSDLGPIIVTEPRKAAATGVAGFVGEAMCFGHDNRTCSDHIGPGFPVGYQVSGDRNWDSACQLIYVTDGTMINWVREGHLATIGTVIVDEAHERSENIDIILAQLRDQLQRFEHLRVIVTSATMDKDFFIEYFGGSDQVFYQKVEARKRFGYGVPFFIGTDISDTVIECGLVLEQGDGTANASDLKGFEGWAEIGGTLEEGRPEDLREVTRKLRDLRRPEVIPVEDWKDLMPGNLAQQVVEIAAGTDFGDILGFLPTTVAINEAVAAIKGDLALRGLDFDVYPLLSTTPVNIRDKALEGRSRGEKRKIVISSNLAETSLTVKGVRYVVDSGLICQSEWDPAIASGSFPTKLHSQSGVRQRWGRVGRDAPGWVFPLYSLEQFRSFARNTPPGSTQTNLETFYMKLLSAGLDLDRVSLPANFVHESVDYDEDARRNIDTFNLESTRAKRALVESGAVDQDGHLTEFGRELERFPGSGAQAVAIMLADQLACVHEVALTLAVLGDNRLIGEQGIFRFSRDWPSAWRIYATRCHRALAIGCSDDLDVLLRVVSEWQSADNPEVWCAEWWINEQALVDAQAAVGETISTLSPAMKSSADRHVMPGLADRARAVITRAMGGHQYHRVEGNKYKSSAEDDSQDVQLSRSILVDPGERIIALNRFRPQPDSNGEAKEPIIANAIRVLDWAEGQGAGTDEMGFDLIVRAANLLRDRGGNLTEATDSLRAVRQQFPIGAVVDIAVGEKHSMGSIIEEIKLVSRSFEYPGEPTTSGDDVTSTRRRRSSALSGFDPDWDPFTKHPAEIPPEEAAQQIINVRELESSDNLVGGKEASTRPNSQAAARRKDSLPLPKLYAVPQHATSRITGRLRVEVVGYQLVNDTTGALVVAPVAAGAKPGEPTAHTDLSHWDLVALEVRGPISDHEDEFVELSRVDGRGSFYLRAQGMGIDTYGRDFAGCLRPGARLTGRAIPGWNETEPVTITLVPTAVEHLQTGAYEQHPVWGEVAKFYAATVRGTNERDKLVIELDHRDAATGLSHWFTLWKGHCAKVPSVDVGQRLLVAIGRDPKGRRRRTLRADIEGMPKVVGRNADILRVVGKEVHALRPSVPLSVILELLALKDSVPWTRDVWLFHVDNLRLDTTAARPITLRKTTQFPRELAAMITARKSQIGQRHNVSILIDQTAGTTEIVGADPLTMEAAANELKSFADLPFVVARVPSDMIGKVIGKGGETISRLQKDANILNIQMENDTVTVVGETANAVQRTIGEIRSLVTTVIGEIVVPVGKNGLLIGRGGSTIKSLSEGSGCRLDNPNRGQQWTVEGPTEDAVRKCIQMATQTVTGTTGRIREVKTLKIITDATKAPSTAKSRKSESPPRAIRSVPPAGRKASEEDSRQGLLFAILIAAAIAILVALVVSSLWK